MPDTGDPRNADTGDPAILDGARRGEEGAWSVLYRDLAPRVRGFFRAQGAAHPDDLTGDVFLEVARRIGEFRGNIGGLKAWVFTIAHSRLVDEIRRSCRRGEQVPLDHVAGLASGHDVEGEVVDRLRGEELLAAAGCLTAGQREVVMLRIFGGLSVVEVASALGTSPAAVKMLHHRAVCALREHFAQQGVTELADERLMG
jgi:RNA polymerase sigma-70 factor (ECF subfamily)